MIGVSPDLDILLEPGLCRVHYLDKGFTGEVSWQINLRALFWV